MLHLSLYLSDSELSQSLNRLQEDLINIRSQGETWSGQGKQAPWV